MRGDAEPLGAGQDITAADGVPGAALRVCAFAVAVRMAQLPVDLVRAVDRGDQAWLDARLNGLRAGARREGLDRAPDADGGAASAGDGAEVPAVLDGGTPAVAAPDDAVAVDPVPGRSGPRDRPSRDSTAGVASGTRRVRAQRSRVDELGATAGGADDYDVFWIRSRKHAAWSSRAVWALPTVSTRPCAMSLRRLTDNGLHRRSAR